MLSVKKTVFGNIEVKTAIKIMNHPRKILAAPVISSSSLAGFDSAGVKFDLAVVFAELDADGELAYIGEPDEKLAELPTAVVLFCQAREGEGYRDFSWARKVFQREDFGQVTHLGLVTFDRPSETEEIYAPVMPRPRDLEVWSQEYPDLAWLFPWSLAEDVRQLYAQSKILTGKQAYFPAREVTFWPNPFASGAGEWGLGALEGTPSHPPSLTTHSNVSFEPLTASDMASGDCGLQHALVFAEGGGTRAHSLDLERGQVALIEEGGDYSPEVGSALKEYSRSIAKEADALARELQPEQVIISPESGKSEERSEFLKRVLQTNPSMHTCELNFQRFPQNEEAFQPFLDILSSHQGGLREICVRGASMTSKDLQRVSQFEGLERLTLSAVDLSRCCVELGLEANPVLQLNLDGCTGLTPDWLDFVDERDKKRMQVVYSPADLSWFLAHSRSESCVSFAAEQLDRGGYKEEAWLAGVAFSPFYPWALIFGPSPGGMDLPRPDGTLELQDPWSGAENEGGLERIRASARAALESWPRWEVVKSQAVPEIAQSPEEIAAARCVGLGFAGVDSTCSAADRWSAILGQRSYLWSVNPLAAITINGLSPADLKPPLAGEDTAEALTVHIKCSDAGHAFQVDLAPEIGEREDIAVEVFWALGQAYPGGIEHLTVVVEDSNGSIDPTFMLRGLHLIGEIKRLDIEFPNQLAGIADLAGQAGVAREGRQFVSIPTDMAWLAELKGLRELSLSGDAEALSGPLRLVDFEQCLSAECSFKWDPKLFATTEMNLPTCSHCGGRKFAGNCYADYAPETEFYEVHRSFRTDPDSKDSSAVLDKLRGICSDLESLNFDDIAELEDELAAPYSLVDGEIASGAQIEIKELTCTACGSQADANFKNIASTLSRDFEEEIEDVQGRRSRFVGRRNSFIRTSGPNPIKIKEAMYAHWQGAGIECPDCSSPVEISLFRTWEEQRSESYSGEIQVQSSHPITTSVTWTGSSIRSSELAPSDLWPSACMMDVQCSKGCWAATGLTL